MKPIGTHNYFVYIITNKGKTVLYTGMTNNLPKRLSEHEEYQILKPESFTGKYKCHYLVYWERFQFVDDAYAREKQIKGWTRNKKDVLIESLNPDWRFLNDEVQED
jgi:putative endonuclease